MLLTPPTLSRMMQTNENAATAHATKDTAREAEEVMSLVRSSRRRRRRGALKAPPSPTLCAVAQTKIGGWEREGAEIEQGGRV